MTWERIAAAGTDPELLRAVVTAATVDPPTFRSRLAASRADGHAMPAAVRAAAASAPLPVDPRPAETARRWGELADLRVAVIGDPGYPGRLASSDRDDLPPYLVIRGGALPDGPAIALVGSRRATPYGREMTAWIAEACGEAGVRVVSGGAVGIDAAAHEAARATAGGTTVVLGCGHLVAYPRPHAISGGLFERVRADGGALISELLPGTEPRAHRVRARNRLVAGLVDVVVVVEGGERSGTLVTAGSAADQGITVMAVPGDVRAPGSAAPHRLLDEGADLCRGPQDVLARLALDVTGRARCPDGIDLPTSDLPREVARLLAARWPRPVQVDDLAAAAGVPTGQLLSALTRARIAGTLTQSGSGVVLTRRPAARAPARE